MRRYGALLLLVLMLVMVFVGCIDQSEDHAETNVGTAPSLVPPELTANADGSKEDGNNISSTDSTLPKSEDMQTSTNDNFSDENNSEGSTESIPDNPQPSDIVPEVDPDGLEIGDDVVVTIEDGQEVGGN